ncbi:sperm acrosome-associated protein 9 isoform X2 [Anolis carolinensis]|uniref:sperm acrosome-associated protein 9 isoform X2 n=1 Tax=Anolis carolinensis TaxID=28377 RepID=UPI002F2B68B6
MNEIKESLRNIEQTYKVFQQQQFTFIAALEHSRENAHDKIKPISSIGQVQTYTDHYCNNTTDRRILLMFLSICADLSRLCQRLEALHSGNATTNALLDRCKTLVSHSNDLSAVRAKYPHDVVNHLSCDEARNHYGGVVSLIPVVLDCMKEWVAHSEKLPRHMMQSERLEKLLDQDFVTHRKSPFACEAPAAEVCIAFPCKPHLSTGKNNGTKFSI